MTNHADTAEPQVLLKIEHLRKAYGDNVVLKDINLEVHKGEVIVIVGPSGCGKSTFLRCINALEPIQGGSVVVEVMKVGQQIIEANRMVSPNAVFGIYGTILLLYFLICWPVSMLANHLEKKWN